MSRSAWISAAILALALLLRVMLLGLKPAHFDEGVNGWFVDQMTKQGYYQYDPTNFHGPLHFYVLFAAQTLLGRHEWALRLPLALVSTACVGMMLAYRRWLGEGVCQLAALAMAVSPGFVFYGRYAIHESWLVFFLLLTMWGLAGLCHFGSRRYLWAAGIGLAGLVLTKETYIIHCVALALGYGCLLWLERYSPSAHFVRAPQLWTRADAIRLAACALGAVVLVYSGFFLCWPAVGGLATSLVAWTQTGTQGQTGHEKAPWYWLELMSRYELPTLLGLIASAGLLLRGAGRSLRWVAISGAGALFAYSIVAYKTPWCLISIAWPFLFVFGAAVRWAAQRVDRWVAGAFVAFLLGGSLTTCIALNFWRYSREDEPYAYVQTTTDVNKLLGPLRTLAARDKTFLHRPGYVVMADFHPLLWLLGDFTDIGFVNLSDLPADVSDSEFFLVAEEYQEEVERSIQGPYYREKIVIRGNSGASQQLYFRAATFAPFFPGRTPEFTGPAAPAVPEKKAAPEEAPSQ